MDHSPFPLGGKSGGCFVHFDTVAGMKRFSTEKEERRIGISSTSLSAISRSVQAYRCASGEYASERSESWTGSGARVRAEIRPSSPVSWVSAMASMPTKNGRGERPRLGPLRRRPPQAGRELQSTRFDRVGHMPYYGILFSDPVRAGKGRAGGFLPMISRSTVT